MRVQKREKEAGGCRWLLKTGGRARGEEEGEWGVHGAV
jgi:hypothetical protein